ncbi:MULTISPECIES: helix-turn-helix domain-containing protein [Anaeromyxobacter]|uniref:helix-turn-helix domain-containing protein n=1 Tax=Anaeromyxobacter TaxID=161492 RepID=UPI001F581801|nr:MULTISPECIES: helix-turn-helix domain-containing protein [unclassified Anaeromyxobacter]
MKPLAQQTLYEILEVPADSTPGEIEAAYARARELYAPGSIVTYSLMAPEDAELLSARLDEARATLLDPAARARYDVRIGAPTDPIPSPWPPAIPPVIPALTLAPAARDRDDDEDEADAAPPAAVPAEPSRPAAWATAEAPRPAPIRLDREVAPTRTPPPVRAPLPALTPAPGAPPPPAREAGIPDATAWTGEVLRQIREARGISLQLISERTKVTRHHIENIEADRYSLLPAAVYLRGILLGIARELRLDGQKVARSYLERMAAAAGTSGPAPRR